MVPKQCMTPIYLLLNRNKSMTEIAILTYASRICISDEALKTLARLVHTDRVQTTAARTKRALV